MKERTVLKELFENNTGIANRLELDGEDILHNLQQVRSFAVSDTVQIMVINIGAFRKSFEDPDRESKSDIIHRPNDKLNGSRPIEIIAGTNPIVIIDEPQSVDRTPKSKQAVKTLNPLCTLPYPATHVEKHNLVYKLDAVDAFRMNKDQQIRKTIEEHLAIILFVIKVKIYLSELPISVIIL